MPSASEGPSLLSRLRRPLRRRRTAEHSPQTVQPEPSLQIDRRILQDPSALLDSEAPKHAHPLGLTPSTRPRSAAGSGHPKWTGPTETPLLKHDGPPSGSSVPDALPRTPSRSTLGRISRIAVGSEWSTFGRKRELRVPDAPGVSGRTSPPHNPNGTSRSLSPAGDSKHLSADSTPSTFSLSRLTNPSRTSATHDRPSSPSSGSPQQSPDAGHGSERCSPTDTMSSKRHPQTPQRESSHTAPASVTSPATVVNREPALDSPHTFGHPTPPDNRVEFSIADPSPPPPLPSLDHPELAALRSFGNAMSGSQPTTSVLRDRLDTLPAHRRTPRKDELFPSLSLTLGRSLRHQFSLPQATHETQSPNERRRARSVSASGRQRRTSADWSAYQATVGVNSHANQAWPAEVSREILRLSLSRPVPVSGSSEKRGADADPVRSSEPPDRAALSPSFLPFPPHTSRPSSPPPPAASATPAGAPKSISFRHHPTRISPPDGRETLPPRPHSLRFKLGNRTHSEQPAKFSMGEVKRSLSAIEARSSPSDHTSGATRASVGLSDPDPTSAGAPRAPLRSLALTPSRSLFTGRVSLIDTPTSPFMQGEPSTPTPEPRHLSDKSRGKRKAEDNIDLTPPEQKKEGQHATFLLPSERRSQRVSNSSHAPSSYHRKRARLSTTSPFATPVQSRPASVQETPQSAGRVHRFASLSSSTGARIASHTPSRAASTHSHQPPTPSTTRKHERHQSVSQISIPISAYISPHAPSIGRSTKFHMRDPRKPPKKPNNTPWGLRFATEDEPGSPMQAWCFFFGFLFFPVWWIAGLFLRVPTTRIAGDIEAEKGVAIDDPQIEHDARIWRFRCRVMAIISLLTYVPFIVLVAIFAPR